MAQYDIILNQNISAAGVEYEAVSINLSKGDLLSANLSQDPTVLSAGTDGYVLSRDDATTTGLKWIANASTNYYLSNVVVNSIDDVDFIISGGTDIEGIDFSHTHAWADITSGVPTYDNYQGWNLSVEGTNEGTINNTTPLNFVGTGDVTVSYSSGTLTINNPVVSEFSDYGTDTQVPYMNGTNDFSYSSNLVFTGTSLNITGNVDVSDTLTVNTIEDHSGDTTTINNNTDIVGDLDVSGSFTVDTIDDSGAGSLSINSNTDITGSLDVSTDLSASTIKLTTGATDGYYLKSDSSGNGTWAAVAASQVYKGTWDASTNTPTLADGTGTSGWYYRVTTAGTQDLGSGNITFSVGDDVSYNGSTWERIPAATITGNALTKTDDTNVTLTLGGSPSTALVDATSITVGWSGTLADGRIESASDWNEAYSNRITSLTTTGTSGPASLSSNVLNIPEYTYTHPTEAGDDINIDTTALTGATVISDLDLNITTNTLGHVTDANGTVSTRNITLSDLGYTGATDANKYVHPTYSSDDFSIDSTVLSGATVISDIDINITTNSTGHVTDANGSINTRDLTLSDLGYTGDANANAYTHPTYNGDDFDIDTGALSGATVISDLDINLTTDATGHVVDANATVSTRNITLANLGYTIPYQTLSWNDTNGNLTISGTGGNTVDLDGRYLTSATNSYLSGVNTSDLSSVDFTITNGSDVSNIDFRPAWGDVTSKPTLDNYVGWDLYVDTSTLRDTITSREDLKFVGGDEITLAYSTSPNTITITGTNNYLTGVSGSGDGSVTFTRDGLSNLTWDSSHTHSEYDNYQYWTLFIEDSLEDNINSGHEVNFIGGTDISIDYDSAGTTDNDITINYTGSGGSVYQGWELFIDDVSKGNISSTEQVNFKGGSNISLSYGDEVIKDNDITIDYTGISGSGSSSQIAYWSGTDTLTSDSALQFDGTTLDVVADGYISGSLSIGTDSPTNQADTKFVIYGGTGLGTSKGVAAFRRDDAPLNGSTIGYLASFQRINNTTAAWYLGADTSTNAILASNNSDIRIGKDYLGTFTENMRIEVGGDVGIGVVLPDTKLHVDGDVKADDFVMSSDPRLKNIEDTEVNGLDLVRQMNPVLYKWKDKKDNYTHIGFLTNEIEKIRPELVTTLKSGYQALSYSKITAINTAGIKDLNKKVETIEQELKELKNGSS